MAAPVDFEMADLWRDARIGESRRIGPLDPLAGLLDPMAAPIEWLGAFQVNTGDAGIGTQEDPEIIGLAGGNILVAWEERQDGAIGAAAGWDIIGKIYDAEGNLVRDSYQLNTASNGSDERDFHIAATSDGGFVMVYIDDEIGNPDQTTLRWERYDPDGNSIDSAMIATENGAVADLSRPSVAVDLFTNGSFVSYGDLTGAGDADISGVLVTSAGVVSPEFAAAQNTADFEQAGGVAVLAGGNLVSIYREDDASINAEARIFDSNGVAITTFQITTDPVGAVRVAGLAGGNWVAVWEDSSIDNETVYEIFSPTGTSIVGPFDAAFDAGSPAVPDAVALPDGGFVIVWENAATSEVTARRFDADGVADGAVFTVGEVTQNSGPEIGVTADGRILFAWEDDASGEIFSSIWDPRGATIDAADYQANLRHFVETSVITARAAASTVNGDTFANTLLGQSGGDTLFGNGGDDTIQGGGGADSLLGGGNFDSIEGGAGDDTIAVLAVEFIDDVDGGGGTDTLDLGDIDSAGGEIELDLGAGVWTGAGGTRTIAGIEEVIGTLLDDTLAAGGIGGVTLEGWSGDDILDGGLNAQTLEGGAGDDTITGDVSFVSNAADRIEGGGGDDSLSGARGDDTILGGLDDDFIEGLAGGDSLDGSLGTDTISYAQSGDAVNVTLNSSTNSGGDAQDDTVLGFDSLIGSDFDDTLYGDFNVSLRGGAGADSITGGIDGQLLQGGDGADTLFGEDGDDSLIGAQGADSANGGEGADLLEGRSQADTLQGGGGADTLDGGGGVDWADYSDGSRVTADLQIPTDNTNDALGDSYVSIENLRGSALADNLGGDAGANRIEGGVRNDVLVGRAGDDTMVGGPGFDQIAGQQGVDSFLLASADEADYDRIVDLALNETILLDGGAFGLAPGALDPDAFVLGNGAQDAEDRLIYLESVGKLFFDPDGAGGASRVLVAIIENRPTIDADNFTVI